MPDAANPKQEKLKQLYDIAMKMGDTPPPKRAFLASKCPKCGAKLNKESVKELIVGVQGENQFINKIVADAALAPGAYNIYIDHYTCPNKDYEYAKRTIEEVSDAG